SVADARKTGSAFVLRESWRRFTAIRIELERESETSVARALREIEMWMQYPALTPEFSSRFHAQLDNLNRSSTRTDFLETWSDLKRTFGAIALSGFEAHWAEVSGKFRKLKDRKQLSWEQLETAAKQVRNRAMPPIYKD